MLKLINNIKKIFHKNKETVKYQYHKPSAEQLAYAKRIFEETGEHVVL